ncbi:MAG: metal-dependent hydrolase [Bacteroidota bacterium]
MDILTHICSGLAVATVVASLVRCRPLQKGVILFAGALGGAFPDIDAVSLWSGFDGTIGTWFGLEHSGSEIYSSTFWYSHHVFFHSILGALLVSSLIWALAGWIYWKPLRQSPRYWCGMQYLGPYSYSFFFGYLLHLMGDLPTPEGSWGGIALFYPLKAFFGGWGATWWWNNYDIFLILFSCVLVNVLIMVVQQRLWEKQLKWLPLLVFVGSLTLIGQQLNRRQVDFNQHSYQEKERISLEIQQEILPPGVYKTMRKVDEALPVYF